MRLSCPSVRQALAVVAAAAAAAVGALIAGEYDLAGVMGVIAGAVLAALVAEVVAAVGDRAGRPTLAASALLAGGATVWAAWISVGRSLERAPAGAWAGAALAVVLAPVWLRSAARRGERTSRRP